MICLLTAQSALFDSCVYTYSHARLEVDMGKMTSRRRWGQDDSYVQNSSSPPEALATQVQSVCPMTH